VLWKIYALIFVAIFLPGKTLLFFGELQEFPNIATALKYFCIDGRFDVICSGSMLGINYRKIESNSVGYKTDDKLSRDRGLVQFRAQGVRD